mmetsp:Transcript_44700/g.93151  ORF Transcript_44700/g.93151 Transcript_44700/m.93151 type:complete len:254 (-) Transcript_44700:159-920(-)
MATKSCFVELCHQRNVKPEDWRKSLASPIIAEKCLLDMTDEELEEHYQRVEERAENTKEDRALIVLEKAQDGRLERQACKVFASNANSEAKICADQVPEMLESLRYELTNTEVHYLLRKFDATEDFDMIPEAELNKKQWLWMVGECEMLKESYNSINPEAFEICYETMVQNLKLQKDSGMEGSDEWPHLQMGQFFDQQQHGPRSDYKGGSNHPYVWGMEPDEEEELSREISAWEEEQAKSKKKERDEEPNTME